MAMLEVSHLEKHFGETEVLKDINFSLEKGQSLAIIGSSGSGKTTLLRCLNFLESPDSGTIHVDGQLLLDGGVKTKTSDREVRKKRLRFGLVFQNFNLFPQYTALENVMLASQLLARERPDYKQRKKEIFAEIISAEASHPGSLKAIKDYFPKTYQVYQDMMKARKKR